METICLQSGYSFLTLTISVKVAFLKRGPRLKFHVKGAYKTILSKLDALTNVIIRTNLF